MIGACPHVAESIAKLDDIDSVAEAGLTLAKGRDGGRGGGKALGEKDLALVSFPCSGARRGSDQRDTHLPTQDQVLHNPPLSSPPPPRKNKKEPSTQVTPAGA